MIKSSQEILNRYKDIGLPIYPRSGVIVLVDKDDNIYDSEKLIITKIYEKQLTLKSGDIYTGVILEDPINCRDANIKKGSRIFFKAINGHSFNINKQNFKILEEPDILAILPE